MSTTVVTKVGTKNADQVVLLDAAGDQVTSFGGGTQYADGTAAATPTGTQINWNDAGTQRAVSAAKPLPVTASIDTTGLATSAKQDTGNTSLSSIDGKITAVNTGAVVVSSSALPSGASSLAEQQTQTTHLATIAGDTTAIETSVQLIDDTVATLGTTTYTEATTKGIIIGAVRRDADTTLANTTNEVTPLQVDANGYLKVEVFSGATLPISVASAQIASGAIASEAVASGAVASGAFASGSIASGAIDAGAIAAGATAIAENEDVARAAADRLVKVAQVRVDAPPSGANVSGTEDYTQFIADSYGKTWVAGSVTEDVAHAGGESIMGNGSRRIDTAATSAGSSGDWATVDSSAEGALWVTATPTTTSGLSVANFTSGDTYTALTNSAQVIKASAGNLYGYYIYNPNATAAYVMVYNIAAASVTVGTSTALLVFCIPATSGANLMFPYPITFSNAGWSAAAATTGGGNTAPGTSLEAMFWYK